MAKIKSAVDNSMSSDTESQAAPETVKQSKKKCCDPREGNCSRKDWHEHLAKLKKEQEEKEQVES
tara:strand:+ start:104 stop:298 length:195 start_codon:yes stop_codon:yes gene_type:complete